MGLTDIKVRTTKPSDKPLKLTDGPVPLKKDTVSAIFLR